MFVLSKSEKVARRTPIGVRGEEFIFSQITVEDISFMLRNAENGFDDIISTRSKAFKEHNLDTDSMTVSQLKVL